MKRVFESGNSKRKRKALQDEEIKLLPKVDKFFTSNTKSTSCSEHIEFTADDHAIPTQKTLDALPLLHFPDIEYIEEKEEIYITIRENDIGTWNKLSEEDISFWINEGPSCLQNPDGPFDKSRREFTNRTRQCTKSLFNGIKANGEKYDREWLVYSKSTGRLYCFVCKLLSISKSTLSSEGFDDWRNPIVIKSHENSLQHRDALLTYLSRRRGQTIDHHLQKQIIVEQEYWKQVLQRIVSVIRTLAERGLAFRGGDEQFGSPTNGNFLGILELIAEFDPFLANHIKQYGNRGKGNTSYLSKTISEEMIKLMSSKVRASILEDIQEAGYFSISVDSTPDLSHVDQLTVIIRYVSPDDDVPVERFLTFLEIENHTGEYLANIVYEYLVNECGLDFSKCRGQSYDNAANMSGKYKGMQSKIREKNRFALYLPCAGHSLNLVGRAAVDCCLDAVNFFGVVQQLYNFFSGSTHRWAVLQSYLEEDSTVLKRLCDTRWEAHSKATSAVLEGYDSITSALDHMYEDVSEKGDTRREAGNLRDKMEELEFALMLELWNRILKHFHHTSKALQDPKLSLGTCSKLYASLDNVLVEIRDNFDEIELKAKERLPDVDYKIVTKRRRRKKVMFGDGDMPNADDTLLPREKFRVTSFVPIIEALQVNLQKRAETYHEVADAFDFLIDINISEQLLRERVETLMQVYPDDVNNDLVPEVQYFQPYIKQNTITEEISHQDMYHIIKKDRIAMVFPNVETVLKLFLSLPVTNCSGERSFSRLKHIKNETRTTMGQERLSSLSILYIERDKLRKLKFEDIIKTFSYQKARSVLL